MKREITTFRTVPDFAKGFVKDLRVRWALEEAGWEYTQELIDHAAKSSAAYRTRQPFSQVPVYRDDQVEMFETGAIILYLAQQSTQLAPDDVNGAARVASWVFAALNTIEPAVATLAFVDQLELADQISGPIRKQAAERVHRRLADLNEWLSDRTYLTGKFSAADIVMTTVLRDLDPSVIARFDHLRRYRQRCEERPAFGRALQAQLNSLV